LKTIQQKNQSLKKETLEFQTSIKKINEEKEIEKNKMKEMLKQMEVPQRKLETEKSALHFNIQTNKTNIETEKCSFERTLNKYKNKFKKRKKRRRIRK
jgi:hypothetical protein